MAHHAPMRKRTKAIGPMLPWLKANLKKIDEERRCAGRLLKMGYFLFFVGDERVNML
jgi:hypothetical protein